MTEEESYMQTEPMDYKGYLEAVRGAYYKHTRTTHQYILDAIKSFGVEYGKIFGELIPFYKIWDDPIREHLYPIYGLKLELKTIVDKISSPATDTGDPRFLVLNGPPATAKSRIIDLLTLGVKNYSRTNEGALYTFNWELEVGSETVHLPCIFRDNPLYLLTTEEFNGFVKELKEERKSKPNTRFLGGDLCFNCRSIFDSLLLKYNNPEDVRKHVKIRRYYMSECSGISNIGRGASEAKIIGFTKEFEGALKILRSYNPNVILNPTFDFLAGANRGILNISEAFDEELDKKSLILSLESLVDEEGKIEVGGISNSLDIAVFLTTNPEQYKKFRNEEDKKGEYKHKRLVDRSNQIMIRSLSRASDEQKLYEDRIFRSELGFKKKTESNDAKQGYRHIAPNSLYLFSLFVVSTGKRKPSIEEIKEGDNFLPFEKALLLDDKIDLIELYRGHSCSDWNRDEVKKNLRAEPNLADEEADIYKEHLETGITFRVGEDLLGLIINKALKKNECLNSFAIFDLLKEELNKKNKYTFMKNFSEHHPYQNYLKTLDDILNYSPESDEDRTLCNLILVLDVKRSMGFIDHKDTVKKFKEYFENVTAYNGKKKLVNRFTQQEDEPNEALMRHIEKKIAGGKDTESFRNEITWATSIYIDKRKKEMAEEGFSEEEIETKEEELRGAAGRGELFEEIFGKHIQKYEVSSNAEILKKLNLEQLRTAMELFGTDRFNNQEKETREIITTTINNMTKLVIDGYSYCPECAKEVFGHVLSLPWFMEEDQEEKKT